MTRSAIVEHPAAALYELVADIESYPRFLPWCRSAEVRREAAEVTATLSVGMGALRQQFTTRNENRPPEAIDMRFVSGPFRHFAAAWRFKALGPQACKVEFSMELDFDSRVTARLLEPVFDRIADTMVDAFTRRADELHGKPSG